ncbi:MAG: SDR family oxidoreductase [Abditibacteriaceae bacterium]
MKIDLSGKLALITGASGQLGRVMARTLADCGADIVIHYHQNQSQAAALQKEITTLGRRAMIAQADVTDPDGVKALHRLVKAQLGDPDILVLNAVIQYDWVPVLQQSYEDYQSQFRSCVGHAVLMTQAFVPAMTQRGQGRVIGINTECAMQCAPSQSAYVAGKRGMDGVMRVLAREVGSQGVTVNQVAPGDTVSEINRINGTERIESYEAQVPLRRRGQDQEIANAVAFLASDLASFISGVYLPVCGGNVMPTI